MTVVLLIINKTGLIFFIFYNPIVTMEKRDLNTWYHKNCKRCQLNRLQDLGNKAKLSCQKLIFLECNALPLFTENMKTLIHPFFFEYK